MQCYKAPYDVPNACSYCMNFAENALLVSFGSFTNAKLLDFFPSDSTMTLCINGTLCTHALYTVVPSAHA